MKKQIPAIVTLLLLTAGCASTKEWQATGGSRSDGIVVLSYSHNVFEVPAVDDARGLAIASERCKLWGYPSAHAFGGETRKCTNKTYSGCEVWQVDKTYQCTNL